MKERECFICAEDCNSVKNIKDELLVSDFEKNKNNPEVGVSLGIWKDSASSIKVTATIDSIPDKGMAVRLEIKDNMADGEKSTSGGGIILEFLNCNKGLDLRGFKYISFNVKVSSNSLLDETRVKLEDISNRNTPERYLIKYNNKFPKQEWIEIRIPLTDFGLQIETDTSYHRWTPTDISGVKRIVTVIWNDRDTSNRKDGTMWLDDVKFLK